MTSAFFRKIIIVQVLCLIVSCVLQLQAQVWKDNLSGDERNFYKIQQEFNKQFGNKSPERNSKADEDEKTNESWMVYKRWEWFWAPRVSPGGELPPSDILSTRMKEYKSHRAEETMTSSGWSLIGPSVVPSGGGGEGRVNCVAVFPSNSNIIFAGSASGGLWKSTNGGVSWTTTTDAFGTLGITAIVFDPVNPDTMYVATGDGDAGDSYSVGVLKSTDGGITWNATGLNYSTSSTATIRALVIDPANGNILLATTGAGIYRTTNGGASWSLIVPGSFHDLRVNPADPTIWYATKTGAGIYKSTNTGASFSQLSGGLPTTGFQRIAVAIAPSSPSMVYALYVNSAYGFYGLYRSTNAGATWALQSNSPNILSWDGTGSDGQGWYDLVLDVDPTNAATIYAGGINMYKSTTSGTSWTELTMWYTGTSFPYIHADQHGSTFQPGNTSTLYVGNDGGVFKTTNAGSTWSDISGGLTVTQYYRLGTSATNVNRILAGAQDNGTTLVLNGNWSQAIGGDGMEALVDYTNENIGYGELYYGDINRTTNGGISFTDISSGILEDGGWVTPYIINPVNPKSLYLGTSRVYKTTNRGNTWTVISGILTGQTLVSLAIAPADTNTIYAADNSFIYKTTNGGTNWTNITNGLPSAAMTYIAVHPTDPQTVYITYSGYENQKVYKTTNGGTTWANMSNGLPGIPVNCITMHPASPNYLYVGTDAGVYFSIDAGNSWQQFSNGLPNVIVDELEFQAATNKLRAATYGRGLWEIQLGPGTGSIAGRVFFDANNNGVDDAGEQGLSNWNVHLSGAKVDSQVTDANGNYSFSNLPDGQFTVRIDQQAGWTLTSPAGGSMAMTITNGSEYNGKNFVNYVPGIYENFDGATFPPAGWMTQIVAGDSGWRRSTLYPRSGTSAAFSGYQPAGTPGSAWLITQRLAFGTGTKELRFWVRRDSTQDRQPDTLKVKLSLTDNLPSSFTTTVFSCYSGDTTLGDPNVYSTTYKQFVVPLTAVSGPAYLAFIHEDMNGQSLSLDDVVIDFGSLGPLFSLAADSLSFGLVPLQVSKEDTIAVWNLGSSMMTISSTSSNSSQFLVSPANASISPFGSRNFYIIFYPTSAGSKNGKIIFTSDASSSPDSLPVSGIGSAPQFSVVPSSADLGNVRLGTSAADTLTVTNTGTMPLRISSVSSSDAHFTISPTSDSLAPSASHKFIVVFTPTTTGPASSAIFFTYNAADSPKLLMAQATGVTPGFYTSSRIVSFGKVLVNQSETDSLIVSNFGDASLNIASVTSSDSQFTVFPVTGSIAPSASDTFDVTFSPVSIGGFSSMLIFTHDASTSPDTLVVRGSGADTTRFRTFIIDTALGKKSIKLKVVSGKPALLPLPANWRDSVVYRFDKKNGVVLGLLQKGSAAMKYGWIRFPHGANVAKFFKTVQTNSAYDAPFDTLRKEGSSKNKKKFVKELHPASDSYTNPLAQAFTVFKLNLYSSRVGITPRGMDSLVYASPGSPWNGMSLVQIANKVDSVLTKYQTISLPGGTFATVGSSALEDLRTMLNTINAAFYSPIALANGDSVVAGRGLQFPGMIGLQSISFLDKSYGAAVQALNTFAQDASPVPDEFALRQNYPNPFNPTTTLSFVIGHSSLVTLKVYDVLGREVATLVNEQLDAGEYDIHWDASAQASGVYFYRLQAGNVSAVKKLMLMK